MSEFFRPHIPEVTKNEVFQRERLPQNPDSINMGWSAVETALLLENRTLSANEKDRLHADLKEKIDWGRKTLEFFDLGGYSKSEFDKFTLGDTTLPAMDNYYKEKTGDKNGFLQPIATFFKNKKGHRLGWKFDNHGQEKVVVDYVGMLADKQENGVPTIPDEILLEFFKSYNYVIAQKTLEIEAARPEIISIFKAGLVAAVERGIIPPTAKERLAATENAIKGFSFGDPLVRARDGYPDARNNARITTTTNSEGKNTSQQENYIEFFRYDVPLGHTPYHELMHLVESRTLIKVFSGQDLKVNLNEALTERLTLSIFGEKHHSEMSREDDLTGDAYLGDRKILDAMLQKSPDGERLYQLLTELYFTDTEEFDENEFLIKQQAVQNLL